MSTEPTAPDRRPQVLFVCVHNAGRSQMAAALLEHHAAGRVDVRSAGSAPAVTTSTAASAGFSPNSTPEPRGRHAVQHDATS